MSDLPDDVILSGFNKVVEFCKENKINAEEFLKDEKNIELAVNMIHNNLSFIKRKVISKKFISSAISNNLDDIRAKFKELSSK